MNPLHVIEGALVGAFTIIIAASDAATSLAWQIVIFAIGIALGAVCVSVADWQLRRQHDRDQQVQRQQAGRDA